MRTIMTLCTITLLVLGCASVQFTPEGLPLSARVGGQASITYDAETHDLLMEGGPVSSGFMAPIDSLARAIAGIFGIRDTAPIELRVTGPILEVAPAE